MRNGVICWGLILWFSFRKLNGAEEGGHFFIHTMEDYQQLQNRLSENRWRNTPLESVSIHELLNGTPASMVICVTRHGTLVSSLQRQLLDLPCCGNFAEDGVFCGHAWGASPGSEAARNSAFEQACRMGVGLGTLGYKGILGIDFIVHETQGKAWPIEINPRLTGALPMLSLLHLQSGTIPMEVFHMLEFPGYSVPDRPGSIEQTVRGFPYREVICWYFSHRALKTGTKSP